MDDTFISDALRSCYIFGEAHYLLSSTAPLSLPMFIAGFRQQEIEVQATVR